MATQTDLAVLGLYDGRVNENSYYRLLSPFNYLQEAGFGYDLQNPRKPAPTSEQNYQIIHLLHSTAVTSDWQSLLDITASGGAILGVDLDRDVFLDPEPNFDREKYREFLGEVDYITCPTGYFKERLSTILEYPAENVFALPNLMDFRVYNRLDWYRQLPEGWASADSGAISMRQYRQNRLLGDSFEPVVIGLQGDQDYYHDWTIVAPALKKIAGRYGDRVRFIVAGPQPDYLQEALQEATAENRVWWLNAISPVDLPEVAMNFDINLCPLLDDDYSRARSPLKWLEGSAAGAASVVSPTVYANYVQHGQTALLAQTAEDWEEAIVHLLENRAVRQKIGRMAHAVARLEFNLEDAGFGWFSTHFELRDTLVAEE